MRLTAHLLILTTAAASLVFAADLPSGESLIQRYIDKSGGAQAYAKAKNMSMTGKVEMEGRNISGTVTIMEEGRKAYTEMEFPGIGKIEEGYDGDTAWEDSALQGPRLLDGDEKAAAKRAATLAVITSWREVFKDARTIGPVDLDGKPGWQVEMTPKEGKPETYVFERDSGLLVKTSAVLATAMGDIASEATMSDFRSVNGILTPFAITEKAMSQTIVMRFDKVAYNAAIPPDRFDPPSSVKSLRKK
jgi:hypothetical protein